MDMVGLITLLLSIGTFIFIVFEFRRKRSIEKIEFFLKFRIRLKEDESLVKITKFITNCELDPKQSEKIPPEITAFEFYYFLGFIEELSFVHKHNIVTLDMIDDMFGFYILAIAENTNMWNKFDEDPTHTGWKNFHDLANKIKTRREQKLADVHKSHSQ
jgi:hypothetical protein